MFVGGSIYNNGHVVLGSLVGILEGLLAKVGSGVSGRSIGWISHGWFVDENSSDREVGLLVGAFDGLAVMVVVEWVCWGLPQFPNQLKQLI
jgi:hypothetical protein